jgi:CheY-like chemotaxis protein
MFITMKNNKAKFLLIEDSHLLITNIRIMSEDKDDGFDLVVASNMPEAIKALEDSDTVNSYDIIFLDGDLSGSAELETLPLLEKIKAAGFKKPIIAISASHNDKLEAAGATKGIDKTRIVNEVIKILKIT